MHRSHRFAVVDEPLGSWVKSAESAIRAHPYAFFVIDVQSADPVSRQRMGIGIAVAKMTRLAAVGVEHIETVVFGACPNLALRIDQQRPHAIAREGLRPRGVVPELLKFFGLPIPARHATAVRG